MAVIGDSIPNDVISKTRPKGTTIAMHIFLKARPKGTAIALVEIISKKS